MKKLLLIVLNLVFFRNTLGELPSCLNNCPVNEVFSKCGGGLCEPNTWKGVDENCPCTPGCVCKPGYARDPNTYICEPKEKCPAIKPGQCAANEEWSDSLAGCQKSCYTMNAEFKCLPVPGCVCKEGFIRCSIFGQCIPKEKCQTCPPGYSKDVHTFHCNFCCQECPENEEYNECGTSCESTCKTTTVNKPCNKMCKVGCFCKNGYVRDDTSGKCIPKEWCKSKGNGLDNVCPKYETFSCGNPFCEKKCSNFKEPCTVNIFRCEDRCYCNEGYARNDKNMCVPFNQCY